MQVKLQWNLGHLGILTAVADDLRASNHLPKYGPGSVLGQHWRCYRSIKNDEDDHDKNLQARLTELFTPSTPQEVLDQIPKRAGEFYCPYLRFTQKTLNVLDWLVDGHTEMHHGAHFPLCVWTHNASSRSKERQEARAARAELKRSGSPQKPRHEERKESSENSRSRGAGASVWNTHSEEHPQYGVYVSQSVQAAYASQRRSWEGNSWNRGGWRDIDSADGWCAEPKW